MIKKDFLAKTKAFLKYRKDSKILTQKKCMSKELTSIEKIIIEAIFHCAEKDTNINKLYEQYKNIEAVKRTITTAGFFTDFNLRDKSLKLEDDLQLELGSVHGRIKGLKHGAGFILFIRNGLITSLEGYCYDELWPNEAEIVEVFEVKKDGALVSM